MSACDKFDDRSLPGDILVTVTLKEVSVGTEVNILQEGPAGCHCGGGLLSRLAGIVEKSCTACGALNQSINLPALLSFLASFGRASTSVQKALLRYQFWSAGR
jgi:hypothetical protein